MTNVVVVVFVFVSSKFIYMEPSLTVGGGSVSLCISERASLVMTWTNGVQDLCYQANEIYILCWDDPGPSFSHVFEVFLVFGQKQYNNDN